MYKNVLACSTNHSIVPSTKVIAIITFTLIAFCWNRLCLLLFHLLLISLRFSSDSLIIFSFLITRGTCWIIITTIFFLFWLAFFFGFGWRWCCFGWLFSFAIKTSAYINLLLGHLWFLNRLLLLRRASQRVIHIEYLAQTHRQSVCLVRIRTNPTQTVIIRVWTFILLCGGSIIWIRCLRCWHLFLLLDCIGSSLEINILLVDPDQRELPNFEVFVLRTGHQDLLILMPLHRCDSWRVCLQHKDWLLLLVIPNCDESVGMSSDDLSPRSLAPLKTPHILFALQCQDWLDKSLFACCHQIKDRDRTVYASSNSEVFSRANSQAFDLRLRLNLDRDYLLLARPSFIEEMQVALSVWYCQAISVLESDQLL